MEGFCFCLFPFMFICIIAGILFSVLSSRHKAIADTWEKFASDSGLNVTFKGLTGMPKIGGKYRDFDYVLETVTEGYGEDSITYTVITLKSKKLSGYHLHIYQESFLSKIGKMFGGQDIQIGNEEFDTSFIIKSQTPDKIHKLLTMELQRKMLYGTHLINLSLSEKTLQNKTAHIIDNTQDLLYLSELMAELAMNGIEQISSNERKEITDRNYKKEEKPLSESTYKTLEHSSDFTSDFNDYNNEINSSLKEDKICPSCGSVSPGDNKYCIDCGREI